VKAGIFGELPGEVFKRAGGLPDARLGRIEVREYAENAPSARGPAREGVHMKQIVALVKRQVAPVFLKGTKTREVEYPLARVGREKLRSEADHLCAVVPERAVDALGCRNAPGNAAKHVVGGAVRHVLVHAQLGPLLRQQKLCVLGREIERRPGEK
jgi:hypothetical protein